MGLFLLRIIIESPLHSQHGVAWHGALPRDGAPLSIDGILRAATVMKDVEGIGIHHELSLQERARQSSIQYQVVGVELTASVASAAVHRDVGLCRELEQWDGISGVHAVTEVGSIDGLKHIESRHRVAKCQTAESLHAKLFPAEGKGCFVVYQRGIHLAQHGLCGTVHRGDIH